MTAVLLDTHAWVWALLDAPDLPQGTREAIARADAVFVSPMSFYEIGQKVRLEKWPEMATHLDRLEDLLRDNGGLSAPLTPEICLAASTMDWPHRDPFDRIIAATAEILGLALVTRDAVFATRPGLRTIW